MSRRPFASSLALILAVLAFAAPAAAQGPVGEARVKAAFVFNFLKFVEWPATSFRGPDAPIVVGVVGGGLTAEATERFLFAKQVGTRPVAVRPLAWDESMAGVHAIFVSESDVVRLRRVVAAASQAAVLSIGEGADFASFGGVIALVVEDRKVRFDINVAAAQASGLRVSSKLLALTRVVHTGPGRTENRR